MNLPDLFERLGILDIFSFLQLLLYTIIAKLFGYNKLINGFHNRRQQGEFLDYCSLGYDELYNYERVAQQLKESQNSVNRLRKELLFVPQFSRRDKILKYTFEVAHLLEEVNKHYAAIANKYPLKEFVKTLNMTDNEIKVFQEQNNLEGNLRLGKLGWSLYSILHCSYQNFQSIGELSSHTIKHIRKTKNWYKDLKKQCYYLNQLYRILQIVPKYLGLNLKLSPNYDFKAKHRLSASNLQNKELKRDENEELNISDLIQCNSKESRKSHLNEGEVIQEKMFLCDSDLNEKEMENLNKISGPRKHFFITEYDRHLKKLAHQLCTSYAASRYVKSTPTAFLKLIVYLMYFPLCLMRPRHTRKLSMKMKSEKVLTLEQARFVFDLLELPALHQFVYWPIPRVKHHRVIYIPNQGNTDLKKKNYRLSMKKDFYSAKEFANSIKIRFISNFPLCTPKSLKKKTQKKNVHKPTTILFHVHGGGYIGQSSYSHKPYLQKWVQETNALVVSVDYTNPPDTKYPDPLIEVIQAYKWVINHSESIFGIAKKDLKMIMAGDSAGGNLVASTCVYLIHQNLGHLLPDALILAYPVTNLTETYSLSQLVFAEGPFLSAGLLKLCLNSYLNKNDNNKDQFISPLYAKDNILEKFPKTFIQCGISDPFLDNVTSFANRLSNLNRDVTLRVYNLTHSFWSLESLVPACGLALKHVSQFIKEVEKK
ncbi:triacylglycerol lipase [Anaeramoeba flamelloides]|uniref:Triacylglycerol lipase n=1 Tax=Anaeramoeba flamelloides TaxID=1746091 RepID=A0ABQ8YVJ9_9EUKA|nr:triacylglycerol lipase [Anaeramoeba flamelloides]